MGTAAIPLEWFCETLNKRLGPPYNIPFNELFLVVPHPDEAEFDFEISPIFKPGRGAAAPSDFELRSKIAKSGASQGNLLTQDYPHLAKLLLNEVKKVKIKVFFVHPSRLRACLILWTRKYNYPKISLPLAIRPVLVFENTDINIAFREAKIKEALLAKYN